MKKSFLIVIFSVSLLFVLNGCQIDALNKTENHQEEENKNNEKQSLDVRETVWNQLTKEDKKHIKGDWSNASVQKIMLKDSMGIINDKKFIGKEVYIIEYPSNDNPTIGGVTVYADTKTHQLIGYGYRD